MAFNPFNPNVSMGEFSGVLANPYQKEFEETDQESAVAHDEYQKVRNVWEQGIRDNLWSMDEATFMEQRPDLRTGKTKSRLQRNIEAVKKLWHENPQYKGFSNIPEDPWFRYGAGKEGTQVKESPIAAASAKEMQSKIMDIHKNYPESEIQAKYEEIKDYPNATEEDKINAVYEWFKGQDEKFIQAEDQKAVDESFSFMAEDPYRDEGDGRGSSWNIPKREATDFSEYSGNRDVNIQELRDKFTPVTNVAEMLNPDYQGFQAQDQTGLLAAANQGTQVKAREFARTFNPQSNADVSKLQGYLKDLGYDIGKGGTNKDGVDGILGPKTEKALRALQGIKGASAAKSVDVSSKDTRTQWDKDVDEAVKKDSRYKGKHDYSEAVETMDAALDWAGGKAKTFWDYIREGNEDTETAKALQRGVMR